MTREEAIQGWIIPAIKNTWNEKKCQEIIKALEQEPCEDAISREAVSDYIAEFINNEYSTQAECEMVDAMIDGIQHLQPVTPQPKTGHWIVDSATSSQIGIHGKKTFSYEVHCDKCGWKWAYTTDHKDSLPSKFCPNCGEKKEGEETE